MTVSEVTFRCHYEARREPDLLAGYGVSSGQEVVKDSNKEYMGCLVVHFGSVASVTTYNADASQGPTKQQCEDAYKKLSAGESASLDLRVPVPSVGEIGEFYRCYSWDHKQESETFGYWIIAPPVLSSKFINK